MSSEKHIPLIKPYITQEIKDKVSEVLDSGYLTEGPVTHDLEEAFKNYIGCKHAVAATSCTTGLEMALRALGIGHGAEVIVPDYTYPATADVVLTVGARAVIVDVDPKTMLIDYEALERAITQQTKAVIPVSLFGNPLNYERLWAVKEKYGLYIVEDAACSIGAEFNGIKVGSLADISVFSLHPRKFITTGEGGIITTNNSEWADWINSYKHFGIRSPGSGGWPEFERIGTNYKLSDVQAAIGLIQMNHMEELRDRRRELARNYMRLFEGDNRIQLPETTNTGVHSYQSFCIFLENRDQVMKALREKGIEVQIGTYALHLQKAFKEHPNCQIMEGLGGAEYAFNHCLTLPLYHDLSFQEQSHIVSKVFEFAL